MKPARNLLELGRDCADSLPEESDVGALTSRAHEPALEIVEFEPDHCELLTDPIVQLASDSGALGFLRAQ